MIIQRFETYGFLGRQEPLKIEFNSDINIVTGYNGAGKTNLLKIVWYTISGNITLMLEEVEFESLELETSEYSLYIRKRSANTCEGWFEKEGRRQSVKDQYDEDDRIVSDARDVFSELTQNTSGSLFFPTFRRIEGGFTIGGPEKSTRGVRGLLALGRGGSTELQKAVVNVAQTLSNQEHQFITSISTIDISDLLLRRYTSLSETSANAQGKMTQEIIGEIRAFRYTHSKDEPVSSEDSGRLLDSIADKIEQTDLTRDRIMAPFKAVQDLVIKIFRHKAIKIDKRLSFGDAADAISSDLLSAGEKQMLSFICYNAFSDNIPIFIDEPELSLHVDWQRTLFPTLETQEKSNQFIIATHSPFIYGKYPEKEIGLTYSRGNELGDEDAANQ